MNARERFIADMTFQASDRALLWEFGYWTGTLRRWYKEGLPKKKGIVPDSALDGDTTTGEVIASPERDHPVDEDVHDLLGFDTGIKKLPADYWVYPPFEKQVIEEDEENIIYIDDFGIKKKERKDGQSMPTFLDWPVRDMRDFEKIKERFNPEDEGRLPANWSELLPGYTKRDYVLAIGGLPFGFFGAPRYLMGLQNLCIAYYDNPTLIQEMVNFLTDFWVKLWTKVLHDVQIDFVLFWEDMCYKNGSLISAEHFRKFMLPGYKKLTSLFRDFEIQVIFVDTDGNCTELVPLFIEGGVTGMFPFEVQAGMDIVKVRKEYPKLGIIGGLDKGRLAQGKRAIDEELEAKLPFMLRKGGYVPCADHLIPPDVPWENFLYWRKRIKEFVQSSIRL